MAVAAPTSPRRFPTVEVIAGLIVAAVVLKPRVEGLFDGDAIRSFVTVFMAIVVQATPFLVLGVTISGLIAAFVSPALLTRLLPSNDALAVPVAGIAGAALPGCECGSVPIAGRLIARGAPAPAAMAFLLAAPAINPVVMVATAVAFPGQPKVVLARFLASFLAAVAVGLVWTRIGKEDLVERARRNVPSEEGRWRTFADTAIHDFTHAGGYLVVGAAAAAFLQTVVPRSVLDDLAGTGPLAVLALAALAVVLAICSEADAFVAASLSQFSLTSRLAFMVVGPAVDIKLVALQVGTFGRRFAVRFAPLTFAVAVLSSVVVGTVLL